MDLNIAILPEDEAAAQIIQVSSRLADEFGGGIRLNLAAMLPHLTLYLTGFPASPKDLGMVAQTVGEIVAATPRLDVRLERMIVKRGSVLWLAKKTSALDRLHRTIVKALNPLRKNTPAEFWDHRRARLGPAEQLRLKEVGFPKSLDAWAPHVTVAKVTEFTDEEVQKKLAPQLLRFEVKTLGIGKVGPHGTFQAPLERVTFGGA